MTTRVLDRVARFDTRSLNYKIEDHFDLGRPLKTTRHARNGVLLNQGNVPGCVGWSAAQLMAHSPKRWLPMTDADGLRFYDLAKQNDQYAGENYDGSSVLGGQNALKLEGDTSAFYWATSIEQLQHGVMLGTMQAGTNWYDGMFSIDDKGYVRPTGKVAGGHAYCLDGIEPAKERFTLYNQWGAWGVDGKGYAYLDFADAERLMHESGDFALPVKNKPPRR